MSIRRKTTKKRKAAHLGMAFKKSEGSDLYLPESVKSVRKPKTKRAASISTGNINKDSIISFVAGKKTGRTIKETKEIINSFLDKATDLAKNGKKVVLRNFATIEKVHRNSRRGHNPRTGKSITIPAKNVIKIKASKTL